MEYVSVRDFRTSPKAVWGSLARNGKLIITNNGKPTALMLSIDSSNTDETLASVRQAEAMRLVNKLRLDALKSGVKMGMDDIDSAIRDIRQSDSE